MSTITTRRIAFPPFPQKTFWRVGSTRPWPKFGNRRAFWLSPSKKKKKKVIRVLHRRFPQPTRSKACVVASPPCKTIIMRDKNNNNNTTSHRKSCNMPRCTTMPPRGAPPWPRPQWVPPPCPCGYQRRRRNPHRGPVRPTPLPPWKNCAIASVGPRKFSFTPWIAIWPSINDHSTTTTRTSSRI